MSDPEVLVRLSHDEALVLFEWFQAVGDRKELFADQSEQRAVWDLTASLESQVSTLFSADYAGSLELARSRVRDQLT